MNFDPVETSLLPSFISVPIMAGLVSYTDLPDMTLDDFKRLNEVLAVKSENEHRAHKAAESESKRKG